MAVRIQTLLNSIAVVLMHCCVFMNRHEYLYSGIKGAWDTRDKVDMFLHSWQVTTKQ